MRRTAVDQPEQGHQPGPGDVVVEQDVDPALHADGLLQPFVERAHPIGLCVDRVVHRQQLPGLGEQADDQPHHDPDRRLVQRLVGLGVGQRLPGESLTRPGRAGCTKEARRFGLVRLAEDTSSSRYSTA